jgi:hypothetical protein
MSVLLDKYGDRKWVDVEKELESSYHLLTMTDDDDAVQVAKAFESHGTECGMNCLAAFLHMEKWGTPRTTRRAVDMYIDVIREDGKWPGSQDFQDMVSWTAWLSTGPVNKLKWPLAPTKWPKGLDKRAGLANVMLFLSAPHLRFGNSQVIAQRSVMKFLVNGMKKSQALSV